MVVDFQVKPITGFCTVTRIIMVQTRLNSLSDGIDLKQVRVQSASVRVDQKDVEDKFDLLLLEVGKLQEQLAAISSYANGSLGSGQTTIHMQQGDDDLDNSIPGLPRC